jgi:hypothetical protein
MVGIVGILLLGSLAWSAVGALFSALGEATASFSTARPTPITLSAVAGTGTPVATPGPRATPAPTQTAVTTPAVVTTTQISTAQPTPAATSTPAASARAPWILLPQPAPDSRVMSGALVIEARGRGDTPIASIRLDLDGVPLAVSLEQRSESTWRGFANAKVGAGQHAVRATVVDAEGRTGGFRWTFDAGP